MDTNLSQYSGFPPHSTSSPPHYRIRFRKVRINIFDMDARKRIKINLWKSSGLWGVYISYVDYNVHNLISFRSIYYCCRGPERRAADHPFRGGCRQHQKQCQEAGLVKGAVPHYSSNVNHSPRLPISIPK